MGPQIKQYIKNKQKTTPQSSLLFYPHATTSSKLRLLDKQSESLIRAIHEIKNIRKENNERSE